MLLFFSCQELVNNDQQRALTSRTPPRESSRSPTRAVSWVNRLFCSETDCTQTVSSLCELCALARYAIKGIVRAADRRRVRARRLAASTRQSGACVRLRRG